MKTNYLLGILMLLIVACGSGDKQAQKKAQLEKLRAQHDEIARKIEQLEKEVGASDSIKKDAKLVEITPVTTSLFEHYIEVQGKLDGDESIGVSPLMSSRVISVNVKVGDNVRKGQVLAVLDDAAVASSGQSLDALKNSLKLTTDLFERQKRLYEQKIGSEVAYLQVKTQKENLEKSIATIEDMIYVKAPIDGTVEEVTARVGQLVSPQLPTPPFRIISFKKLKVTAEVAEAYASKIQNGDKVDIYFPDINSDITAIITAVSKYINPTNRTFTVEADLVSSNQLLKANMVAVMKINDYKNADAVTIPVNLIQKDLKGQYVVVAEESGTDTVAKKVNIQTGIIYNGIAEIKDGLKSGDKLITAGFQDIQDGDELKF